jgi:hypothetical protein
LEGRTVLDLGVKLAGCTGNKPRLMPAFLLEYLREG